MELLELKQAIKKITSELNILIYLRRTSRSEVALDVEGSITFYSGGVAKIGLFYVTEPTDIRLLYCLAHEMGHYQIHKIDKQQLSLEEEEVQAWKYAEQMVGTSKSFLGLKRESLATYGIYK